MTTIWKRLSRRFSQHTENNPFVDEVTPKESVIEEMDADQTEGKNKALSIVDDKLAQGKSSSRSGTRHSVRNLSPVALKLFQSSGLLEEQVLQHWEEFIACIEYCMPKGTKVPIYHEPPFEKKTTGPTPKQQASPLELTIKDNATIVSSQESLPVEDFSLSSSESNSTHSYSNIPQDTMEQLSHSYKAENLQVCDSIQVENSLSKCDKDVTSDLQNNPPSKKKVNSEKTLQFSNKNGNNNSSSVCNNNCNCDTTTTTTTSVIKENTSTNIPTNEEISSKEKLGVSPLDNNSVVKKKSKKISVEELEKFLIKSNPKEIYSNFRKIGRGSFGSVYIAARKGQKTKFAIKQIKKKFDLVGHDQDSVAVANEIALLRSCHHPNIVNFIGCHFFKERIWIVMEYCDGGTLSQLLELTLSESEIANVLNQVLNGVAYLHSLHRIHRDIKSSNILLNMNGEVKVADLGLCIEGDGEQSGIAGSKYWMAPEMIQRQRYTSKVIHGFLCLAF